VTRRKYVFGVLVAAVAALSAVSAPYAHRYWVAGTPREPARKTAIENYHQIIRAQYAYHVDHDCFPAGIATEKTVGLSWRVAVLPYLGEDALYKQFRLAEPWDSEHNKKLIEKMPAVFASPGNPAPPGHTFVRTTQGPGGMIRATPGDQLPQHVTAGTLLRGQSVGLRNGTIMDGTSNTALFLEGGEAVPWTEPDEITVSFGSATFSNVPFNLPKFGGVFDDGFHVALVDGSLLFLRHDFPERPRAALLTPNGGETFPKYEWKEVKPEMTIYRAPPPQKLPELLKLGGE
jgi:hypothetical protein